MKTQSISRPGVALFFFSLLTAHADDLPQAPSFKRYDAMMQKSPFAVATAIAPPPQTPNFAKDLYIANVGKVADEGVVSLSSSTDRNLKEYLSTKGPNASGYSIVNIDWSARVGETKVTIAKDGQTATLNFNQALLSQPAANGGAMPPPPYTPPSSAIAQPAVGVPSAAFNNPNTIKPAPIPTLPTPPPRVRGVIPRNPAAPTPAHQGNTGILPDEQ